MKGEDGLIKKYLSLCIINYNQKFVGNFMTDLWQTKFLTKKKKK